MNAQRTRVMNALADGHWHTLAMLEQATGEPQASISARLREMEDVVGRRIKGSHQWEYRLTTAEPANADSAVSQRSNLERAMSELELHDALAAVASLSSCLKALATAESSAFVNMFSMEASLNQIRLHLKACLPHAKCPYCSGKGCKACNSRGWVPKWHYDHAMKDLSR